MKRRGTGGLVQRRCCDGRGALVGCPNRGVIVVVSGVEPESKASTALGDWLRSLWRRGRTVGGLCTGAYALVTAGILKGHRFTMHWDNITAFSEPYPELPPTRQVVCIDDRVMTRAGGVAAADLMLKLIADRYGAALGQEVMNMCPDPTPRRNGSADHLPVRPAWHPA